MTEAVVLERYRVVEKASARLGGDAFVAQDEAAGGAMVEVHVLPGSPQAEQAFPPARQAIETLKQVPPGPLARALDLTWGPEGELVLVAEYQEGRTLADLMAQEPLGPARAREVLRGILHALALARRFNLHHGGLSPWRVLVDPAADDRVVVLDLGVMGVALPPPEDSPLRGEAAYRAPGDARGPRADAFAVAVIALQLLTGERPEPGKAVDVGPEATQAVGPEFVKAAQALARADGSARAFDAGALLGLLPAKRRRTRRARFTLRETWDGDIGPGTARLLQLGLRPEYRDRMPSEIQGTGTVPVQDDDVELRFTDSVAPRPRVTLTPPQPPRPVVAPPAVTQVVPPPQPVVSQPVVAQPPLEPRKIELPPPRKPDTSPFAVASGQLTAPPPPPPPPPPPVTVRPIPITSPVTVTPNPAPRPPGDPFAALDDPGGAVTMPFVASASAAPARLPDPIVLRAMGGKTAYFLVAPKDGAADLGRERGNDIILRAFKGAQIENVDSNRISRKHLFITHRPPDVMITCGQRAAPDQTAKASTYGTTLDGARLPVEKKDKESLGLPTPLPVGRPFELVLALTNVRLDGRIMPGSYSIRLVRKDGVAHQYVVLWSGNSEATIGSGEGQDALLLPAEGGIVPGHARLRIDPVQGAFQVSPLKGTVRFSGREVQPGSWVPLGSEKVQLGSVTLASRVVGDHDFLLVGTDVAMPA